MTCSRCGRSCHGDMCRDCEREEFVDAFEYDVDAADEEEDDHDE